MASQDTKSVLSLPFKVSAVILLVMTAFLSGVLLLVGSWIRSLYSPDHATAEECKSAFVSLLLSGILPQVIPPLVRAMSIRRGADDATHKIMLFQGRFVAVAVWVYCVTFVFGLAAVVFLSPFDNTLSVGTPDPSASRTPLEGWVEQLGLYTGWMLTTILSIELFKNESK